MSQQLTMPVPTVCLTLREVADVAGRSVRTVRRWIREGKFVQPRRGPGGQLVFLRPEVEAFLTALPTTTESPLAIGFAAEKK